MHDFRVSFINIPVVCEHVAHTPTCRPLWLVGFSRHFLAILLEAALLKLPPHTNKLEGGTARAVLALCQFDRSRFMGTLNFKAPPMSMHVAF
jgi:hypothetical protein